MVSSDQTLLFNMVTGEKLAARFSGYLYNAMLATKVHVLDENDYDRITAGLTNEWLENYVFSMIAIRVIYMDSPRNCFIPSLTGQDQRWNKEITGIRWRKR